MPDQASLLNHRITLESETLTSDGAGGYSSEWQEVAAVWAAILPYTQRSLTTEILIAEQLQGRQFFRFTLRYRSGITPTMRIAYNGRIFNIRNIANRDEKGQWLEILATEGA